MNQQICVPLILASLLALTACGTLEVGIERVTTPTAAGQAGENTASVSVVETPTGAVTTMPRPTGDATEATSLGTPTSTVPLPTITASPIPGSPVLRVAFARDGNVWLWEEGREARVLTSAGGVTSVQVSDDGAVIAFMRGDELWMIRSDGTDERPLVSRADLETMESRDLYDLPVVLYHSDWIPGTHTLAFDTRLRTEIGLALRDDLHVIDADTQEHTMLLPPGAGGEFHCSPDGQQIAVVTADTIHLIDTGGGNRRAVLVYTSPATRSEAQYYAHPVWAADSRSLRVAIPPADPYARPSQPSSIWDLYTDGMPARLLGDVTAAPASPYVFSPDLRHIAYLGRAEGTLPGSGEGLMVTDLESEETTIYYPQALSIYDWSPDSQYFAFATHTQRPQAYLGRLGSIAVPVHDDASVAFFDVRWVDAHRYLFLAQNPVG
jgi:dipeptidyl aminopeptidase/acylaminoacyl peptidase